MVRPYALPVNRILWYFIREITCDNKVANPVYVHAKSCLMIMLVILLKLVRLVLYLLKFLDDLIPGKVLANFHLIKFHVVSEKFLCFLSSLLGISVFKWLTFIT